MDTDHPEYLKIPLAAYLSSHYARASREDLMALIAELEAAIPEQTFIKRERSLPWRAAKVRSVTVKFPDCEFHLHIRAGETGQVLAQKSRVAREIVLSTETLPLEEWLPQLGTSLASMASGHRETAAALQRWLG